MVRISGLLAAIALMAACSADGRGSQYSSARAQHSNPAYIPVTPGAVPIGHEGTVAQGAVLTGPVAITPGAQPILTGEQSALYQPSDVETTTLQPAVASEPARQPVLTSTAATTVPNRTGSNGPIYNACIGGGREAATRRRCGCVQSVADRHLNPSQQLRGAGYFSDQQKLQDVRQSDNAENEAFWAAWKEFGSEAGRQCKGT